MCAHGWIEVPIFESPHDSACYHGELIQLERSELRTLCTGKVTQEGATLGGQGMKREGSNEIIKRFAFLPAHLLPEYLPVFVGRESLSNRPSVLLILIHCKLYSGRFSTHKHRAAASPTNSRDDPWLIGRAVDGFYPRRLLLQ